VYEIDVNSDSEYDSDDLDIIEPSFRSFSSYKGSVKASKWIPRARALSPEPSEPKLSHSFLSRALSKAPEKPKSNIMYIIGARISVLILWYYKDNTTEIKAITGIGLLTLV
jgi:hypothetical protein